MPATVSIRLRQPAPNAKAGANRCEEP
jgi:hypothetical protein